ncbi:MAG: hypothetical protein E7676_06095 [Ruminococcaceae bacterium]|nr:hypothetical protein [Oscillospiraceae bacterium]
MTDKSSPNIKELRAPAIINKFHLDAERSAFGMTLTVCGVIGVRDFSRESIEILTHTGKVFISGRRLSLSIYENGAVEIKGRVEDVRFGYGKN